MSDSVTRFIFDRIVADYVRLWKANAHSNAQKVPAAEIYASHWPEQGAALARRILLAEFKLRLEAEPNLRVETFLAAHHDFQRDEELMLQLLELELEAAEKEPEAEKLLKRFPNFDPELLTRTVDLVLLRRSMKSQTPRMIEPARDQAVMDSETQILASDSSEGETSDDAATGNWTAEKSRTVQWTVASEPAQEAMEGTMAFSAAPSAATDIEAQNGTGRERGGLDSSKRFTVSDSLTVEKFLGSGFWKDVYKAKQQSTRQFVALKHLRENNETEREALVREVRTQAKLTHQNIPPVFGLDVLPSGQALVVEKLVDGDRWSDTINTRSLDDNLRILLEVSQAVAFAHRRHHIIHRDLKPDNVVVDDHYGEVYLIDWGLAADVSDDVSETDTDEKVPHVRDLEGVAGPTELAGGEPHKCTPATDVFLLGALLYEILTGHAPYEIFDPNPHSDFIETGPMLRALRGIIVPVKQRAPGKYIPDELCEIAMKAMAKECADRYADAGFFIEAIKRYQQFSMITNRCDQNWLQFRALLKERRLSENDPASLLALTLCLLETSDIFKNVIHELELLQLAGEVNNDQAVAVSEIHPTLHSARQGEAESRSQLIFLTLETGDLTLADAQIGLLEKNPLRNLTTTNQAKNQLKSLRTARRRSLMMKWIAACLLVVFLGSSLWYGYTINEQRKKTDMQFRRAEENLQRAEENFQQARNAVSVFFTMVAKDPAIKNAGMMPLRRTLLDSARKYQEYFVAQKSDDPDVIAGQIASLFDAANIEANFGNWQDAIDYYHKAVDLGDALVQKYPDNARYLDLLSKCYKDLGVVYGEGLYPPDEVLECNHKALALSRRLVSRFPDEPEYQRNLARILHNLGVWELKQDQQERAERFFRESLDVRDGMLRFPDPPEYHYGKSQTLFALALSFVRSGRHADADREFEAALKLLDELQKQHPDRFDDEERNMQGAILFGIGEMDYTEGQWALARSFLNRAAEPFGMLVEKSPEHIGYQRQLNDALILIFECLVRENKDDEALALFANRETSLFETAALFPEIVQILSQWYLRVGEFHLLRGRKEQAVESLQNAIVPLDTLGEDGRTYEENELMKNLQNRLEEISQ